MEWGLAGVGEIAALPPRSVNMRVLVVGAASTDSQLAVATRTLQAMSVPFDTYYTSSGVPIASVLTCTLPSSTPRSAFQSSIEELTVGW